MLNLCSLAKSRKKDDLLDFGYSNSLPVDLFRVLGDIFWSFYFFFFFLKTYLKNFVLLIVVILLFVFCGVLCASFLQLSVTN